MSTQIESDKEVIARLGGPARVAEILGYEKHGGVQRVTNWVTRGIPSKIKVDHPHLFLPSHRVDADASKVAS